MEHTKAMPDPYLSKDWGEGEDIKIEGPDKELRQKMDNYKDGPRWHPFKNSYIRMKKREGAREVVKEPKQPKQKEGGIRKKVLKKVLKKEAGLSTSDKFMFGNLLAAGAAGQPGYNELKNAEISDEEKELTKKLKEYAKEKGIEVEKAESFSPSYDPDENKIYFNEEKHRPEFLAHELGHAESFNEGHVKNLRKKFI
ncbi:MAG: hypothetical protein ACOCT9_00755 [archaeon]